MRPITRARVVLIVVILVALAIPVVSIAAIIHVPGDEGTIAAGIGAASSGDTVMIACDTYFEHDLLIEIPITLMSETDDPTCVTIDGSQAHQILSVDGAGGTVISGITFTNAVDDWAAAVYTYDSDVTIQHCSFYENFANVEGGALGCDGGDPVIFDCDFQFNGAVNSGGGLTFWRAGGSVTDCNFHGNQARWGGGAAFYHEPGTTAVTNCTFTENEVITGDSYGGGAYCWDYAKVTFTGCAFTGNTSEYCGGGLCWDEKCEVTVVQCPFDGNQAQWGGGVYVWDPVISSIYVCTFTGNVAEAGGGVLLDNDDVTSVTDCDFEGNTATAAGGGLTMEDSDVGVENCRFTGNTAAFGGGMSAEASSGVYLDCEFYGNTAGQYGGAVALFDCPGTSILGCTMTLNSGLGRVGGGGVAVGGNTSLPVENTIIAFSEAGDAVFCEPGSSATLTTSVVSGNEGGDWIGAIAGQETQRDNSDLDPLFCDLLLGGLDLCSNSYCLPGNNGAGVLIGAHEQGCGECTAPVETQSWGSIKAMFR